MPKLLIIDDEKDFLETITQRLEMRGYNVIAKTSGKDIEAIINKEKDIDVVVLDMKMPEMMGDEVLRMIKEQRHEIQVIILTGYGSTEAAVEMAKLDAFTYLQKPVEIEKLVKIIEDARSKAKLLMAENEKEDGGKNWKRRAILAGISIIAGVIVALIPLSGIPPKAHNFLALLITVILLWVTEAIPIGVTAFLTGTNIMKFSIVVALASSLTSSIFHDATITIIFLFAVIPIFIKMGITIDKSTNLSKFFTILIPLTASAGGFGTILGGGRNPIAVEYIEKYIGVHVGFLDWIVIQMPMVLVASLATWAICWLIIPPKVKEFPAEIKTEKLSPMSKNEKGVAFVFILAFIFWTLSDLTKLHVSVVAALALIGIYGLRFVSIKTVIQKFSWEAWLVFGAGVSLGVAMLETGAGKWLADQFFPVINGQSHFVVYYGIAIFGSFISSFMSNSAATALCLPVLDPMAMEMGMSRLFIALSLPVTTSFIMLVIGCPPSIISYSTGYFRQWDFIKVAVPNTLILCAILVVIMSIYWPIILPLLGYAGK